MSGYTLLISTELHHKLWLPANDDGIVIITTMHRFPFVYTTDATAATRPADQRPFLDHTPLTGDIRHETLDACQQTIPLSLLTTVHNVQYMTSYPTTVTGRHYGSTVIIFRCPSNQRLRRLRSRIGKLSYPCFGGSSDYRVAGF